MNNETEALHISHEPVMLSEVLALLETHSTHKNVLDGTLGLGGYSEAILSRFNDCHVTGIDRDTQAIAFACERLKEFSDRGHFEALHANFSTLNNIITSRSNFDAFVFDLGVSNMQLTLPERGFSFNSDGALDMRMNPSGDDMTAADILRSSSVDELTRIFRDYGEERYAHQIARAIKSSRTDIETTGELVKLIRETLPQPLQRKMGTHPARRVFQALRICVNHETEELEDLLKALHNVNSESIIIFVSYHSLEDRLIKRTFREWQQEAKGKILTKHPMTPLEEEMNRNYKSRSAKLRAFCLS